MTARRSGYRDGDAADPEQARYRYRRAAGSGDAAARSALDRLEQDR